MTEAIGAFTSPGAGGEATASVIVCIYNRGMEVRACLDSLLFMSRRDFDLILVDDASTDGTPGVLRRFRDDHPDRRIVIVRNPRNLGVSGARNAGLDAVQTEFVLFTDSDCVVDPGWLDAMLHPFDQSPVSAVGGSVVNPPPKNLAERAYVGGSRIHQSESQGRYLVGCNMAFRTRELRDLRFDEALTYYCDDDDLAWRLRALGTRIAFAPEAVVHHHHSLTLGRYLRQGYRLGRGAGRYWYKRGTYLGKDLWCLAVLVLTLPLVMKGPFWMAGPILASAGQLAALAYNERVFKGKLWLEVVQVIPVQFAFYFLKLVGTVHSLLGILTGVEHGIIASKRAWRKHGTPHV